MTRVEMNRGFSQGLVSEMNECGERTPFLKPSVAACPLSLQVPAPAGHASVIPALPAVFEQLQISSAKRKGHGSWRRRMLERHSICDERRHPCVSTKCVSFGFRHFGPVSTNVLVISDPAMLMKGTPDATTFPRPRSSAQNRAKLTSPASVAYFEVGPLQMNPSELRAMADYSNCRRQLPRFEGSRSMAC
jgi:hypothetical protein